jgi:signal transduction histidine kinase
MGMRFLVIDDDAVDRRAVARALVGAKLQATLDEAATAADGLRLLAEREYDCIFIDYLLPGTDGLQVLRAIRAADIGAPIVILTGQGDEELAVELMRAGAVDYLSKQTLGPDRLARSVRYAVAMARAEHARREALERERAAREEAQAANRAKDQFLATLSHELRTPLNAILGWARLLAAGTLDAASAARAVEIIERNSRLQAQLIEDLLDISRIVAGKLRLERRDALISEIVESVVEAFRPMADTKRIRLDVHRWTDERPVRCDPARLQQVVSNLLANAIKFTPEGGVVSVSVTDRDDKLSIEVRDTGVGISSEFLPFIFDRFRQAEGAVTRTHGGLGLGLSIARHLVELHGGQITAESEGEGRGAAFTVSLPLSRAEAAASSPALQNRSA